MSLRTIGQSADGDRSNVPFLTRRALMVSAGYSIVSGAIYFVAGHLIGDKAAAASCYNCYGCSNCATFGCDWDCPLCAFCGQCDPCCCDLPSGSWYETLTCGPGPGYCPFNGLLCDTQDIYCSKNPSQVCDTVNANCRTCVNCCTC